MIKVETGIDGLFVLEPIVFEDHRGYFTESYSQKTLHALGITNLFVQDNESLSRFGTLRGLHFQKGEHAQAKLIRVTKGCVLDVVVDIRPDSRTFGRTFSCELSEENKKMLMIPRGFAHGFVALSETALLQYKCDNYYSAQNETGIHFRDPTLNIDWKIPEDKILLSEKDTKLPYFKDLLF